VHDHVGDAEGRVRLSRRMTVVLAIAFGWHRLGAQVSAARECYTVHFIAPDKTGDERLFEWVPTRMVLDSAKATGGSPAFTWFEAIVDGAPESGRGASPWRWRAVQPDSVSIGTSDGFVGVDLTFHVAPDTLRGMATYESDVVGNVRTGRVIAWRSACGTSRG
jgi:hypothetical protein